MVSAVEQAKRALVSLLKLLATAYKCVLRKKGTQKVASRFSAQLYSACQEVIKKKGAASRG